MLHASRFLQVLLQFISNNDLASIFVKISDKRIFTVISEFFHWPVPAFGVVGDEFLLRTLSVLFSASNLFSHRKHRVFRSESFEQYLRRGVQKHAQINNGGYFFRQLVNHLLGFVSSFEKPSVREFFNGAAQGLEKEGDDKGHGHQGDLEGVFGQRIGKDKGQAKSHH